MKTIICVETEKEYRSMYHAAKENNIAPNNVSLVLNKPYRSCNGYHFVDSETYSSDNFKTYFNENLSANERGFRNHVTFEEWINAKKN